MSTIVDDCVKPVEESSSSAGLLKGYEKLRNVGKVHLLLHELPEARLKQNPTQCRETSEMEFMMPTSECSHSINAVDFGCYEVIPNPRQITMGAFGIAVLYRKISDDTLVVIKEINMMELTVAERQMALNEVQVLKILDHPNIIRYNGSFDKDGMLFIEMEYADGGTLSQFLSHQVQPIKEVEILFMFQQIVSAIKYMHSFNILHRDLKTANVFLTKDRVVKVGDFGISKMITTQAQANSVLGTPYYISPEMCEGKEYNQKSDIWALGCILYEMACLQKTFDGSNLPALVNKIMKGQFQPVSLEYSAPFRELVYDLLQRDPQLRPTAAEILDVRLSKIMSCLTKSESGDQSVEQESILTFQSSFNRSGRTERSVLYDLLSFGSTTSLVPVPLPPKFKIREVAVGYTHFIALTTELVVYSWGEGRKGQLGQGDVVPWKAVPQPVESLKDKNIKIIAAGNGFSVFVSESGMVMTCGDGSFGCLGHGDLSDLSRPKLIEKLISVDVTAISCGGQHVSALSADGFMYAWGKGQGGRLGLGDEEDSYSPCVVPVPNQVVLRRVRCGDDATMVVTSDGALYACGRNAYNKLGLSNRKHIFSLSVQLIEKSLTLKKVTSIKGKVSDVSLGPNHTAVLTDTGQVITMGRNTEGQLGRKHTKVSLAPSLVKSVAEKIVTMVKSGPTFTMIATLENEIHFWGTRYKGYNAPEMFTSSAWLYNKDEPTSKFSLNVSIMKQQELILEPKAILALYASPQQIEKGEIVSLSGIYAAQHSILVLVDTTVPLMTKKNLAKSMLETEYTEDDDSLGPIPDWIKDEMAQS